MRDRPEIEGQRSNVAEVRFSVPQRFLLLFILLFTLLFSIYVNDLPEVPSGGKLEMFADEKACIGDSVYDVCFKIQSSLVVV